MPQACARRLRFCPHRPPARLHAETQDSKIGIYCFLPSAFCLLPSAFCLLHYRLRLLRLVEKIVKRFSECERLGVALGAA